VGSGPINLVEKEKSAIHPITLLAHIALLPFKEPDSQISFTRNEITIQEPSARTLEIANQKIPFTGIIRFVYGDSREDLGRVAQAIAEVKQIYEPQDAEVIMIFFKHCAQGICSLTEYYKKKSGLTYSALIQWGATLDEEGQLAQEAEITERQRCRRDVWLVEEIAQLNMHLELAEKLRDNKLKVLSQIQAIEGLIRGKNEEWKKVHST
jgi:hypothetical protein